MENLTQEMLKILDIMKEDLSEDQISKLNKAAEQIGNNPNPQQVLNVLNSVGLDLEELQKKARKARMLAKPKKVKIQRNDKCTCGSGKKYKKCCFGKQT